MIDMTPSLALVVLCAVLVGTGVYLMLERTLSRIVLGLALAANGVNVAMLIASGRAGMPPFVDSHEPQDMSDPLPQAMVLTAIVIALATTAFILALAHRSWQLNGHDEVQDDLEDRRLAARAARDERSARADDDAGSTLEEIAAATRDETDGSDGSDASEAVATEIGAPEAGGTADGAQGGGQDGVQDGPAVPPQPAPHTSPLRRIEEDGR